MVITFGLLGLSICSVWLTPVPVRGRFLISPWLLFFIGAITSGLLSGYLTWAAVVALGIFGVIAHLAARSEASRLQRIFLGLLTALLALALATHRLPGFNNPVLIANAKFSADAAPYTQYLNFDKAAVGLILLVYFCNRSKNSSDWSASLRRTYPIALTTAVIVIAASIILGFVRPDFKLSWYTPVFLATNLLFTCVAEEAFFRGFFQERLAGSLSIFRFGEWIAVLLSALFFGAVHYAGGPTYIMLAVLAGLGYAYVYAVVKRIEASIMVHFVFNAIHFIGFTYPRIQ